MRIGVVTTSYPRFPDDPAGNFVGEHVRALKSLGHEVDVIAAADDEEARVSCGEDSITRIPSGGLFYTSGAPDLLERGPRRSLSAAALAIRLTAAAFTIRLTAAVVRRRWDSIIAHWLAPSALACLPTTAPLLAIAHGGDIHTLRRAGLLAPALHLLRARDAHLVFVSEHLRSIATAAAPRLATWLARARVQPMGIDLARFASIPRTPTNPPTLVIAARLVPIKGIDVAIAALSHVKHQVRLVIAGEGPEGSSLRRHAESRGGADQRGAPPVRVGDNDDVTDNNIVIVNNQRITYRGVEFRGAIDTRERDRLLATASIVLVPSRVLRSQPHTNVDGSDMTASRASDDTSASPAHDGRSEGTPLIALEALAAGIPVIASDVGGLRELGGVVRVPPDDPRALAEAIDRVLDAPPTSESLRASVAHLDWRHVIGTLVRNA
ncbi:MAG: glycosyltransferase family 4 protein [Kofleriaceae bacterium]